MTLFVTLFFAFRKQIPMSEHPVVQEYLKSYDHVVNFKDNLGKMFTDRGECIIHCIYVMYYVMYYTCIYPAQPVSTRGIVL